MATNHKARKAYRSTEKYKETKRRYDRKARQRKREAGFSLRDWLWICLDLSKRRASGNTARHPYPLENDLDLEFLVQLYHKQQGRCFVSGLPMTTRQRDICAASIDRVDQKQGYLKTNVVLTCRWVNTGRGAHCSLDQFRTMLASLLLGLP